MSIFPAVVAPKWVFPKINVLLEVGITNSNIDGSWESCIEFQFNKNPNQLFIMVSERSLVKEKESANTVSQILKNHDRP
jgi:hypothetical protein